MAETYTLVDVEQAISNISDSDDFTMGCPHTDEEVLRAEKTLDLTLPESFKFFLTKWGNLALASVEYYGLTISSDFESAGVPNFVWFTLRKREQVGLPKNLVVFQNSNDEVYYCLDTSTMQENDCKVVVWNNLYRIVEQVLDVGFFNFLLGDIEEYVDMMD